MALTKTNVRTRLAAIAGDPATPPGISTKLNRLLDLNENLGRPRAVVDAAVDAYLDTAPGSLAARPFDRVLIWVVERWDELPD